MCVTSAGYLFRLLASILFALFLAQAAGAYSLLDKGRCSLGCRDDDPDGNCGSSCDDCACCGHLQQVAEPLPTSTPVLLPLTLECLPVVTRRMSCDPRSIFHVPKARV